MSARYIVGIDPGKHGALAWIDLVDGTLAIQDMPILQSKRHGRSSYELDLTAIARVFDGAPVRHVMIERVSVRSNEAITSALTQGTGYGSLLGVIAANFIPYSTALPSVWKRSLHLSSDKDQSRALASKYVPECALFWSRKKDDGRAEATLLALHAIRELAIPWPVLSPAIPVEPS